MKAGLAAGTIGVVLSLGYGGQAYAGPRDLASHAAIYSMSLSSANLSGGVTGEVHFVDAGFNVVGMPPTADLKGWTAPENGHDDAGPT